MFHDKIIAAIRTGCAVLGASIITVLVSKMADWGLEVDIDPSWGLALSTLLFGVLVALYNFVVSWATENVWDGFGWLLGVNKPPSYITDAAGDLLPANEQEVAGNVDPPVSPDPGNDFGYGVDPHARS